MKHILAVLCLLVAVFPTLSHSEEIEEGVVLQNYNVPAGGFIQYELDEYEFYTMFPNDYFFCIFLVEESVSFASHRRNGAPRWHIEEELSQKVSFEPARLWLEGLLKWVYEDRLHPRDVHTILSEWCVTEIHQNGTSMVR